tara:strand:- start:415 stop:669 length:255 start_codon:yes stop_codon:yes gene_type:complete
MILASYNLQVGGIEFSPHTFKGHGWLYSYETVDEEEIKKLTAAGAFELKDAQKKNGGTILFRKQNGDKRKPPAKRRGCCGRSRG